MRHLSYLSAFGLFTLLAVCLTNCGGGSVSPADACNQAMAAMCERASTCGGVAALNELGGFASVAECTKGLQAASCTSNNITCPAGQVFQSDQAQKCVDSLRSQTCVDYTNGIQPAACDLVCGSGSSSNPGSVNGGQGGNGGTGSTGGGTGTLAAQDACKQVLAALCERTSTCVGSAGLAALGYNSVSACTTGMQSESCATPQAAGCDTGETYYADQAKLCVDNMATLSCANFSAGTTPAACDLVCQ